MENASLRSGGNKLIEIFCENGKKWRIKSQLVKKRENKSKIQLVAMTTKKVSVKITLAV